MGRDGDAGRGVCGECGEQSVGCGNCKEACGMRHAACGMCDIAYGLCDMVKSNNLYGVYAACVMLHNSRQPLTHAHTQIYSVDSCYPFLGREATAPHRCPICMGNNFVSCLAGCYS